MSEVRPSRLIAWGGFVLGSALDPAWSDLYTSLGIELELGYGLSEAAVKDFVNVSGLL